MTDTRAPFALTPLPAIGENTVALADCGVTVSARDGLALATVLVRKNRRARLVERLREHFRIELPNVPRRHAAGDLALIGTGPEAWLATLEDGDHDLAVRLKQAVGDAASIVDQSSGYAVLRLSGPLVRDVLGRLIPVDVHPRVFKVGDAATTQAAHIGVTVWRLEDNAHGAAVFEMAVFRSMAESFWRALKAGATQFGVATAPADRMD